MAQTREFKTFKSFWPEYLRLHSRPVTRAIHYAGTLGGIALAGAGVAFGAPALIVAAPIATYSLLFASHPIFERNTPATFRNPFLSMGGDFKMLFYFLTGRLEGEFKKHGLDYTGKTGNNQNDPDASAPSTAPAAQEHSSPLASIRKKLGQAFARVKTTAAAPVIAEPTAPKRSV